MTQRWTQEQHQRARLEQHREPARRRRSRLHQLRVPGGEHVLQVHRRRVEPEIHQEPGQAAQTHHRDAARAQRLIEYGRPLGTTIKYLIGIVSPRTFLRWLGAEPPSSPKLGKPGRPRTEVEIRDLVLRLARETGWGYTRILGELKKLGVRAICRSTVINILKEHGLDPPREEPSS
jgi:hypothetical protein